MHRLKKYSAILTVVAIIVAVNVLLFYVSPREIVSYLGVENTYLIAFGIAAIGGLSTFTGTALYAAIVTFSTGGSDPNLLGVSAGLGIFISDSVFFFLAYYGKRSIPKGWESRVRRGEVWMRKVPKKLLQVIVYLYLGFTPLPNDILMVALAVGGVRYRQIAPVLFFGSLTIALLTAHLGQRILDGFFT